MQILVCNATGGTFNLGFQSKNTADIAFDASAADVETALEQLVNVVNVDVTFEGSAATVCGESLDASDRGPFAHVVSIEFIEVYDGSGNIMRGDIPLIDVANSELVPSDGETRVGLRERVKGHIDPSGNFTLTSVIPRPLPNLQDKTSHCTT